ncbi:hypothetical protein AAG906_024452 [Vitis piasezkii]
MFAGAGELSSTEMELYPRQKVINSHPHSPLILKPAQKPYHCGGCKEYEIDLRECYQCKDQKCDFHLHVECDPSSQSIWLQFINCTFTFQQEAPRGKKMVCDGCGKDVKGWFYQYSSRGNPRYLHPCCVVLDLKEKTSSVCLICGNEGNSKDFRSWVYVSRCGKYCYHVACVKGKVERWNKEEASNQQQSSGAGTSSGALVRRAPNQEIKQAMAFDIFTFVVLLIFGVSVPVPYGLVIKWLKRK